MHSKKHSQKVYNMKGCNKSRKRSSKSRTKSRSRMSAKTIAKYKSQNQSIGRGRGIGRGIGIAGGSCSTCSATTLMQGGQVSPLVGAPWSISQSEPSNYYAQNLYKSADPQTMMKLRGGKVRRGQVKGSKSRRSLKGGSLTNFLPSDLVNLGRDFTYNVSSAYSSLTGAPQPVNPSPVEGHLTASINANRIII